MPGLIPGLLVFFLLKVLWHKVSHCAACLGQLVTRGMSRGGLPTLSPSRKVIQQMGCNALQLGVGLALHLHGSVARHWCIRNSGLAGSSFPGVDVTSIPSHLLLRAALLHVCLRLHGLRLIIRTFILRAECLGLGLMCLAPVCLWDSAAGVTINSYSACVRAHVDITC